jgi:hypothetical protein
MRWLSMDAMENSVPGARNNTAWNSSSDKVDGVRCDTAQTGMKLYVRSL